MSDKGDLLVMEDDNDAYLSNWHSYGCDCELCLLGKEEMQSYFDDVVCDDEFSEEYELDELNDDERMAFVAIAGMMNYVAAVAPKEESNE